mmetsp:Transcript_106916/g.212319  ORF Transcript_106916/g.212319 Transcript_106916/m.212319 type:complete len:323 (+) Transcript_106916:29-997(+)
MMPGCFHALLLWSCALARSAFPPTDGSWNYSSSPVFVASQAWEGSAVCEPEVMWLPEFQYFRMYYRGGWGTWHIGVAISPDGIAWTKLAQNPVYPGMQPYVFRESSNKWWLHATGPSWATSSVATSEDGIVWTQQPSNRTLPAGGSQWGNRVVWKEASEWKMIQEVRFGNPWVLFLFTSADGLSWALGNKGRPLETLQQHEGGSYCGPSLANVDGVPKPKDESGLYHLWFHAVNGTGVLPTDIYHATSIDLINWKVSPNGPVLHHLGTGFAFDQVADPSPVVHGSKAFLYYDGDNNAAATAAIGVATADAIEIHTETLSIRG